MRERPCPEEYGRSLILFLPVDHSFKGRQDTGAGITAGGYKAFGILYEIRIVSCFTVREIDQDRGFLIPLFLYHIMRQALFQSRFARDRQYA